MELLEGMPWNVRIFGRPLAAEQIDLGDKKHAFQWRNTAYHERDGLLTGLPTDFLFDSLRFDPRYAELVRKIGFPQ
jgi:hypothetical protein